MFLHNFFFLIFRGTKLFVTLAGRVKNRLDRACVGTAQVSKNLYWISELPYSPRLDYSNAAATVRCYINILCCVSVT